MTRTRAPRAAALGLAVLVAAGLAAPLASAEDLYGPGAWSAMATDRRAQRVGDSLTIVVYENSVAQNSSQAGSQKSTQLSGQATTGNSLRGSGQLGITGQFDSQAQTERSGKLVAQITVTVDGILPNGDLHVSGQQMINVAGDRTKISVKGRVRPEDISGSNTVLSTRLADATIDYDGTGLVSRGAKAGPLTRILTLFGLL
jgi:flagellar L-ring protein precursor FlgH